MDIDINYFPHSKQQIFHESNKRYRAIISGVGFGKSAAGANELIKEAATHPKTLHLMIGPTFPMVKNTSLRELLKFLPENLIVNHNRSDHIIKLINGSEIIYLSGDNEQDIDRIRGLTLASAWGDEVAICPRYMHEMIIARLRDSNGSRRVWYTTTPKGFTWLYDLFYLKKDILNPNDYELFGGTSLDNPYTPEDYKQSLLNTYTGKFNEQEIYGKFIGFEGLVYPEFNIDIHTGYFKNKQFKEVVCGIDWGFTNPSVLLVVGLDGDNNFYVIDEFYQTQVEKKDLIGFAKQFKNKYNIVRFIGDPSEPEFIKMFNDNNLYCDEAINDVIPGIMLVSSKLKLKRNMMPSLYVDNSCACTIREFMSYRYPDKKEGKPLQENPLKINDHALDALRYVVMSYEGVKDLLFDTL